MIEKFGQIICEWIFFYQITLGYLLRMVMMAVITTGEIMWQLVYQQFYLFFSNNSYKNIIALPNINHDEIMHSSCWSRLDGEILLLVNC